MASSAASDPHAALSDSHADPHAAGDAHAAGGYGADAHGGAEHAGFAPFDLSIAASQIFWMVLTFIVLFLFVRSVLLPAINKGLGDRADKIAADIEAARLASEQAKELAAAQEKALAAARAKARDGAARARAQAQENIAAKQKASDEALAQKLASAEARLAQINAGAKTSIASIASETAQVVAEHVGGLKLDAGDLDRRLSAYFGKGA